MQETKRASRVSALVERQETASRSLSRAAGGRTMRSRVLGAATFFLSLQLLAGASAHAQGPQPLTPPKHAHPFQVLRTTLSLGSTTSLVLERTAIGSCHRRRCLDRGRRNLQRRRRNYRLQRLSRIRRRRLSRTQAQPAAAAVEPNRCPRRPISLLSRIGRRRLS